MTTSAMPPNNQHGTAGPAAVGAGRISNSALDLSHGPILYLDDITVSFDGFRALNALTLTVDAGELRCIIGPNGAGKTTMMQALHFLGKPSICCASPNRKLHTRVLEENFKNQRSSSNTACLKISSWL